MKTFKSMIISALMILVSASVTAEPLAPFNSGTQASTVLMSAASSKEAANQLGLSKLKQLKAMSSEELSQDLVINAFNINERTLHLKGNGYVTVEERMDADGKVTFVSKVNVESHYLVKKTAN